MNETTLQNDAADPRSAIRGTFIGRVALDTVGRTGARVGLIWIGILVVLAVLAPLLANSHPILWKVWLEPAEAGQVSDALQAGVIFSTGETDPVTGRELILSSPLLGFLSAIDVTLLVGLLAVPVFLLGSITMKTRTLIWLGVLAVTLAAGLVVIDLPDTDRLRFYRDQASAGHVEWAVYTPIPYSPNDRQRDVLQASGVDPRLVPPGATHWMGTTSEGADVTSRMIHASRIALTIGLIATGIAASIGIVVGGLMGYFSGRVDLFGMRLVEIFSAIPVIFLLIMIVAFYGQSLYLITVVLGLTGWVGYALYVRAEFLKIRSMDYVQAARAVGAPLWSVLFRHMLPNGITPVLVLASFGIASMILTESTLSFLGLGLIEEPSWGQMLNEARSAGRQWGLVIYPGLAIFLTVFAYNLVGEALRDALDPHAAKKTTR